MRHFCTLTASVIVVALGLCDFVTADHEVNLYTFADIGDIQLGLINTETNQLVQVDMEAFPEWPGSTPQHAWTADGRTVYVSVDATPPEPAAVVIFEIHSIDWDDGTADVSIRKVLILDPPGSPSSFPPAQQVSPLQPIAGWTQPPYTQAHGPSIRPNSIYTYATHWTDNRFRVINRETDEFASVDPVTFGNISRNTHGLNFNARGTIALGTGYYYDNDKIDVYFARPGRPKPFYLYSMTLAENSGHASGGHGHRKRRVAAFTHYTAWLNNRYAYTATMQFGPTSLTPQNTEIIGPSLWYLDVWTGKTKMVVGTASGPDDAGIFRSASDLIVAGDKLYVGEEDTLDGSFGDDGYVSVWDISRPRKPKFLKRLKPGGDLPSDWVVSHGITVTPDHRFVIVASYASNYIVKIDTATDTVVKTWGPSDGLNAPHGGFIAGSYR